jgi:hypothetical protein
MRKLALLVTLILMSVLGTPGVSRAAGPLADEATWSRVQSELPAGVLVLRPTWLPPQFTSLPWIQFAGDWDAEIGPAYSVGYRSRQGDVLMLSLGEWNSDRPDTIERVRLRGASALVESTPTWPTVGVYWQEGGRHYAVQAHGLGREDVIRVVASLQPVTATQGVEPTPAPSRLPRSGGIPLPVGLLAGCGALLAGAGVWLRRSGLVSCRVGHRYDPARNREGAVGRP